MRGDRLTIATASDLRRISAALVETGLFADEGELARFVREGAWRIQVGEGGVVVVLETWRTHLDMLACRALWSPTSRVPRVIERLRAVARRRGFESLLSPVVAASARSPYEAAGMRVAQELVSYRTAASPALPEGLPAVRAYRAADFESVCAIDGACFDEFWRYDRELLARYLECERSTVVEADGAVAGFAFCSLRGGDGVLGRVAVAPERRGSGIGLALTHDATVHLLDSGARSVNLCTQADNERSRRLYSRLGFAEGAERLLMLVSSTH